MIIKDIKLKNEQVIKLKNLTVITGANNSGKSTILKDIDTILNGEVDINGNTKETVLIKELTIESLPPFKDIKAKLNIQNSNFYKITSDYTQTQNMHINEEYLDKIDVKSLLENSSERKEYLKVVGSYLFSHLVTENRLSLLKESSSLHGVLKKMYLKKESENHIRNHLKNIFNLDFRLDYTELSNILIRIEKDLSRFNEDLRDHVDEIKSVKKLDDQGDGIKSFLATLCILILNDDKNVFLLDEPEAFLHPPHIIKLGEIIAKISKENSNKQIFISTHSPNLLKGLMNEGLDLDVLRINRVNDELEINILKKDKLLEIIKDPLLSSSRVLEGLFYRACVITEADADSIFYHRVSRKINDSDEIHYTHAHNKQTVSKVMQYYKELELKSVCITDFDIIRDIHDFKKIIENIGLEQEERDKLMEIRSEVVKFIEDANHWNILKEEIKILEKYLAELKKDFNNLTEKKQEESKELLIKLDKTLKNSRENTSVWKPYKKLGKKNFPKNILEKYNELEKKCKEKGLFIVPVGELESWLNGVESTSNKKRWIEKALNYVSNMSRDSEKELFDFISEIHSYLNNTNKS